MDIDRLFPVLTLALGWALNEMGASLRLRREDRRAFGPLLTDLLEMRHRLFGLDAAFSEMRALLPFPPQAEPILKELFRQLIPEAPKHAQNFEEAVTNVARLNPILASRLRGQPLVFNFLAQVRAIAAPDQSALLFWQSIGEPGFLNLLKPTLEELTLDVAWAHGWWTWFQTWRRLKKPMELPRGEKEKISGFVVAMKAGMPNSLNAPNPISGEPPKPGVKPEGSLLEEGEARSG